MNICRVANAKKNLRVRRIVAESFETLQFGQSSESCSTLPIVVEGTLQMRDHKSKSRKYYKQSAVPLLWMKRPSHMTHVTDGCIANEIPMAKTVKHVIKGIRDVQKAIRKGGKGLVILAGDVNPIDVYSHVPVTCEEADIPYCYVPTKEDIGSALGSLGCVVVLLKKHDDYQDMYDEVFTAVKDLPMPL